MTLAACGGSDEASPPTTAETTTEAGAITDPETTTTEAAESLPCEVLMQDVYKFRVPDDRRFDAIVNLGVTEHLTDYRTLTSQYPPEPSTLT